MTKHLIAQANMVFFLTGWVVTFIIVAVHAYKNGFKPRGPRWLAFMLFTGGGSIQLLNLILRHFGAMDW